MTAEDDEALARALQEKYERQAKRRAQMQRASSRARSMMSTEDGGIQSGSDDEGGGLSMRASSHARPPARKASLERSSSHRRGTPADPPTPARKASIEGSSSHRRGTQADPPKENLPDTSRDAELARRLAERSSHHRSNSPRRSPGESKEEEKIPDTSKDAEIARRLAERSSHRRGVSPGIPRHTVTAADTKEDSKSQHNSTQLAERSSHHRSIGQSSHRRVVPPKEENEEKKEPDTSKDAEIARLLAEGSRHLRSAISPSAPPEGEMGLEVPDTSRDEELARRLARGTKSKSKNPINPVEEPKKSQKVHVDADEALARKLEQELKDEELARRLNGQETKRRRRASYLARKHVVQRNRTQEGETNGSNDYAKGVRTTTSYGSDDENYRRGRSVRQIHRSTHSRSHSRDSNDSTDNSGRQTPVRAKSKKRVARSMSPTRQEQALVIDLHELSDRDLAKKLDQEERDAALARSLTTRQAKRVSVYHVEASPTNNGRSPWNCRRVMSLTIPLVVILAAVVGLAFAFSGRDGLPSLPGLGGSPPTFEEGDPFQGKNPDQANRWNNVPKDQGLRLEVLNALDDRWHVNFDIAINQWDSGDPDALSLSTSTVAVDSACSDVTGKLKVCNGDYGETKWRGINQVILSNGYIISSVAKMNEFYLSTADEDQRQYTMCHEIGHGFGLPHTDENFFNADLGNCMDYTSNPGVNKQPDASNYAFLVDLYGVISRRRKLHRLRVKDSNIRAEKKIPDDLRLRVDEALSELEGGRIFSQGNFNATVLHSNDFAESVLIDLKDGFHLQVSKLLSS